MPHSHGYELNDWRRCHVIQAINLVTNTSKRLVMAYECNGATIETDEEGYITDISLWSRELAIQIANEENIEMDDDHWEVVNFLRNYYEEYQIAPAVRVLTKTIKRTLGADKGNSKYLYELFPYGPAKQACKIAGLPKPTGCI